MPLNPETRASLSPDGMFALIKGMSDADIRCDLAGEHRQEILEKVFAHFPAQFLPDKAGDRNYVRRTAEHACASKSVCYASVWAESLGQHIHTEMTARKI